MPSLHKIVTVFDHQFLDFVDLTGIKTIVRSKLHGIKPEFGLVAARSNVNVGWFTPFIVEEEKAIPANSQDDRHRLFPQFGENYCTTRTDFITTGGSGVCSRSPPLLAVGVCEIFSATSNPSVTVAEDAIAVFFGVVARMVALRRVGQIDEKLRRRAIDMVGVAGHCDRAAEVLEAVVRFVSNRRAARLQRAVGRVSARNNHFAGVHIMDQRVVEETFVGVVEKVSHRAWSVHAIQR